MTPNREDIIRMARELGIDEVHSWGKPTPGVELIERFFHAAYAAGAANERNIVMNEPLTKAQWQRFEDEIRADERKRFYGQDRPAECVNGCPANKVCDYCQIVEPVKALIAAEREACAKLCEEHWRHSGNAMNCADAIKARGQA